MSESTKDAATLSVIIWRHYFFHCAYSTL